MQQPLPRETLSLALILQGNCVEKITDRLRTLQEGMIEEVQSILDSGVRQTTCYYGLEYKFVTLHVIGKMSHDEMFAGSSAIHQFAKRQMTCSEMERRGFIIHWIDASNSLEQKVEQAYSFSGGEISAKNQFSVICCGTTYIFSDSHQIKEYSH